MITMIAIPSRCWRSSSRARIWACTVTSSAVVGSSAISSLGSLASAIAIITRWRMPPENSCGILVDAPLGVGDPDQLEQLHGPRPGVGLRDVAMGLHRLGELHADLVERVQRGQRVLEDHRDLVAADLAQLVVAQATTRSRPSNRIRPSIDVFFARVSPSVVSDETVLPEPDSPTMPRVCAGVDRVGDPVDGVDDAVFGGELNAQVLDLQERLAHEYRTLGSRYA